MRYKNGKVLERPISGNNPFNSIARQLYKADEEIEKQKFQQLLKRYFTLKNVYESYLKQLRAEAAKSQRISEMFEEYERAKPWVIEIEVSKEYGTLSEEEIKQLGKEVFSSQAYEMLAKAEEIADEKYEFDEDMQNELSRILEESAESAF